MGVVENMTDVADLVKKLNDIELNRRIVNLEDEFLILHGISGDLRKRWRIGKKTQVQIRPQVS